MEDILIENLKDNSGSESVTRMIWLSTAFIVGAIILAFVVFGWKNNIANWLRTRLESIPRLGE